MQGRRSREMLRMRRMEMCEGGEEQEIRRGGGGGIEICRGEEED
jgi:hypothetical protein